jgi:hypothetical protein
VRIILATSAALALYGALAGSTTPAPSTPQVPDFSGIYLRVGNLWFDPILDESAQPVQRLPATGPNADDIYAGDFANPILQPWAREIVQRNAESEMRLQHVYTADDSCWPSGAPQALNLIGPLQILQLEDHVVLIHERDQQVRRVWLNVGHSANPPRSWYGESVGHYEGDTLVVDTIGQKTHRMSVVDAFGTPHTEQLHVVERFQPFTTPFGKALFITVEVVDRCWHSGYPLGTGNLSALVRLCGEFNLISRRALRKAGKMFYLCRGSKPQYICRFFY